MSADRPLPNSATRGTEELRTSKELPSANGDAPFPAPSPEQRSWLNRAAERLNNPRNGLIVVNKITDVPGVSYDVAVVRDPAFDGIGGWRIASARGLMAQARRADQDYVRGIVEAGKIADDNATIGAVQAWGLGGDMAGKDGIMLATTMRGMALHPELYPSEMLSDQTEWLRALNFLGGHKSVLVVNDPEAFNEMTSDQRRKLLNHHKNTMEKLNERGGGRAHYYTAPDMGTGPKDMEYLKEIGFPYVASYEGHGGSGNPSPITALGVRYGIQALVELSGLSGKDLRFAIQGAAGEVGRDLTHHLRTDFPDAQLIITDLPTREDKLSALRESVGATSVKPDEIYTAGNFFVPSAMAGILTPDLLNEIRGKVRVIGGPANSQWQAGHEAEVAELYRQAGIIVGDPRLLGQGGIFNISRERITDGSPDIPPISTVERAIGAVGPMTADVHASAVARKISPDRVVDELAMGIYADAVSRLAA